MQYSVPITINNRREIFATLLDNLSTASDSYIIEIPDTDNIEILHLKYNQTIKCFTENNFDIAIKNVNATASITNNIITIQLIVADNSNIEKPNIKKEYFYEDILETAETKKITSDHLVNEIEIITSTIGVINNEFEMTLRTSASGISLHLKSIKEITDSLFDTSKVQLQIQLTINNIATYHTTDFILSHPSQFLGLALDYGSESSQMATKRYEINNVMIEDKPEIINLFQQIKLFYTNNKWLDSETQTNAETTYYQEEKGSNFYKSLSFVREHLTENYEDFDKEDFIKSQQHNLKLLINNNSMAQLMRNKFHQLPNLKIIHQHYDQLQSIAFQYNDTDNNIIPLTLKEIKQKIQNTILKTMIESFLQKEFLRYKFAKRCIRLQILIPNIYDSKSIKNTKIQLQKILTELSNSQPYQNKITGWEVQTISESDAAFIGYMSKKNATIVPNSNYAIIDVGKGTTDFSVIKTGQTNSFDLEPIYRNGFAGAGNLITNAIFETIIRYIREANNGQSGVNNFISEKIIGTLAGNDLIRCRKFYEEIERLKFNFKIENVDAVYKDWASAQINNIYLNTIVGKDIEFQTLIDILAQIENGADFFGYVADVCEVITEKVMAHLQMIQQHKNNFSLAGVVLTGRGFLFAPLAEMMRKKMMVHLNIDAAKIVLLTGNELKDICIKGVFNKSIQYNTDSVGHPIQIIKSKQNKNSSTIKKLNTKKWLDFLVGSIENNSEVEKIIINENVLQTDLQNMEIMIGAKAYAPGNNSIFTEPINDAVISVDYTDTGFKIRKLQNGRLLKIIPLREIHDYEDVELKLITSSLFPNYINKQHLRSLQDTLAGLPTLLVADNNTNTTSFNPLLFDAPSTNTTTIHTNDLLF
jgi:hypothetical protein